MRCLLWCFVALCVLCIAGSFCASCGGRVVHGAGSRVACSLAEAGCRVLVACWARARRCGGVETDLHGVSGERFFAISVHNCTKIQGREDDKS